MNPCCLHTTEIPNLVTIYDNKLQHPAREDIL